MKLIAKFDDGKEIQLKEIQGIDSDCQMLIVKMNQIMRHEDIKELEKNLSEKFGKKVIVLDGRFTDVLSM